MLGKVILDHVWKKSHRFGGSIFGSTAIEQHVCPSAPQREHISLIKMLEKSAKAADFPAEALEEEI